MCNLSEGIEEKGIKKGIKKGIEKGIEKGARQESEKFILNMYQQGCTLKLIASVAGISTDEVEAIINKKKPAMS